MENFENNIALEKSVMGNGSIEMYIKEAAKWGKFLAIVGYVLLGLMVLIALLMLFGLSGTKQTTVHIISPTTLGLVNLLYTGICFVPVTYLYYFSTEAQMAVETNDIDRYTVAFENLKSLFKFIGIFTIVSLAVYMLIFVVIAVPMSHLMK